MIGRSRSDRSSRLFAAPRSEGASAVACAAAMPLVVLALAVATDYAKVSHFRGRVQLAADAASLAAAETVARHPESDQRRPRRPGRRCVFVAKLRAARARRPSL